jgi:gas vesicle protein
MRIWTVVTAILFATWLGACSRNSDAERERRQRDQTAGEKVGKAAYWASKRAEKALKSAARDVGLAAQQAHQGWTEAEREDRVKRDQERKDQK